ncbi:NUDIX domain-containing protein [Providencia alcalifaciens]|uniref:Hydrolase, NUDIX family n=3 Tax=Providencia alcalifaciens TaxID=126385 RepID=B6XKM9_9GAMM|nr:NUDIX hydrolase [Providencia alcalifaciens]ATG17127.1 NUDIX hydrolase [Providencia alcalifaciens]EEB44062.1 hydrolase, NUDIX family [Providencia alcalifaciens DSM 30120]EUD08009.1 phosphatase NudJ [Providencia alcalifaciens R90-1475]EUD11475.1 phosphatase NudJ [Providencia alcalifaciens 205/92]MBF0690632.1 NUDIX hydrolase [Providencia alcalifaciens]
MFKPNVTVATLVHAQDRFLVVEEWVNNKPTWNQPAGHLEANETLLQAAARELYEETGIVGEPQNLIKIHQWIAPDNTQFIRFLFSLELDAPCETHPHDDDISACHWVTADEILTSKCLRSPLVAQSLRCFQEGISHPVSVLAAFGHHYE